MRDATPSQPLTFSAEAMETPPCDLCGASRARPFKTLLGYVFVRCAECSLVSMRPRPRPDALVSVYDADYFESRDPTRGYAMYRTDEHSIRLKAERLLDVVASHRRPPGRLLDIGCALGLLLEVARERGWDVAGVEASLPAAEEAGRRLGIPIALDLFDSSLDAGSFDVVTLWDVVEHLPQVRAAMERVRDLLRPGGVVSIVTPDLGSLAARVLGSRWEEMRKMPEHILFFDRRTIVGLLRRTGFEPVAWGTVGKLMAVDEVIERVELTYPCPWLWRAVRRVAQKTHLARRVFHLDPRWKMHVVGRLS